LGRIVTTDKAVLGAQPFLRGMADDHLAKLAALCTHVAVPARQRLFEEGSPADRFWLIDAGQVTTDATLPGQGRMIMSVLGRGDLVGVEGLAPPHRRQFGAVTSQPMQGYEFDALAVLAACDQDHVLGHEFLKRVSRLLVRRLETLHNRLIEASAHAGTSV
jgi:CRP/FNR family transcriptional regulator, cyclic AMP receptor protein